MQFGTVVMETSKGGRSPLLFIPNHPCYLCSLLLTLCKHLKYNLCFLIHGAYHKVQKESIQKESYQRPATPFYRHRPVASFKKSKPEEVLALFVSSSCSFSFLPRQQKKCCVLRIVKFFTSFFWRQKRLPTKEQCSVRSVVDLLGILFIVCYMLYSL